MRSESVRFGRVGAAFGQEVVIERDQHDQGVEDDAERDAREGNRSLGSSDCGDVNGHGGVKRQCSRDHPLRECRAHLVSED